MTDPAQLYLRLLKKTLVNMIYLEHEPPIHGEVSLEKREYVRTRGGDWPWFGHTMIGLERLDNIHRCMEVALAEDIPGDFMECGVWRGGAVIFMRGVLRAAGITDRKVIAADSFEGLPKPDPEKFPEDAGDLHHQQEILAVSLDKVRQNFAQYDLLDSQVVCVKGFFESSLPAAVRDKVVERLAVLRVDCDMYGSTMTVLEHLEPLVSPGGFVIVDDYALEPCRKAVDAYREAALITEELYKTDWTGVWWRKPKETLDD